MGGYAWADEQPAGSRLWLISGSRTYRRWRYLIRGGAPRVAVTVRLADGTTARAGVRPGVGRDHWERSSGRDGRTKTRYEGKGVLGAVRGGEHRDR